MFDQYQTKVMDNYIPKLCRYLSVKLYEIDMIEMDTLNLVKEDHMNFFDDDLFGVHHYMIALQMIVADFVHCGSFGDVYRYQYKQYRDSKVWEDIKTQVKERDRYKCQSCGELNDNKFVIPLHVHHKSYDRIYCEPIEDLQTLCSSCHQAQHVLV